MKPKSKVKSKNGFYVYDIGYGTYEESEYYNLYHTEAFTEEQIQELIHKIVKELILSIRFDEERQNFIFEGQDRFDHAGFVDKLYHDEVPGAEYGYRLTFQELLGKIVDKLVKEHGFKHFDIQAKYVTDGWPNLFYKDWADSDDTLDVLRKFIKEDKDIQEVYNKVMKKMGPIMKAEDKRLEEKYKKGG